MLLPTNVKVTLNIKNIKEKIHEEKIIELTEEDYKKYVENMGIDVDAALEEAGR